MKKITILFTTIITSFSLFSQSPCDNAIELTPGTQQCGDTATFGDLFDDSSCLGNYDGGDDALFVYTATEDGETLSLTLSGQSSWTGFALSLGCPTGGAEVCLGSLTGSGTSALSFDSSALTSGETYYIHISTWPSPQTTAFCLDATLIPAPDCLSPTDLAVTEISTSDATISWTANDTETSWEYQLVDSGAAPADSGSLTSENPLAFSGLTDNTTYDFYLRAICTDGSLSEWVSVSFTTSPLPIVPDYLNDFSVFPGDLWTEGQGSPTNGPTGTTSSWLADGFGNNGFTGAARVNIYSTFPDEWLISPDFDLSAMTYYLNLDAAATEYASTLDAIWGDDDYAALFVSTDGGASWTEMYRWDRSNNPGAAGLAMPEIELTGYGVAKFAIYGESTVSNEDIDFFVDNFSITAESQIPECFFPTSLSVSSINSDSATIGWVGNNEGETYEYQTVEAGTAPADTGTVISETLVDLSGLMANTSYVFYLRAICSDGSLSEWVSTSFTTPPGCGDTLVYTPQNNTTYSVTVTATGDDIVYVTLSGNIEQNYDSVIITDSAGNQLNEQTDGIFTAAEFISDSSVTVTFSNDVSIVNGDITVVFTCGPPPACLVPSELEITAVTADGASISWMGNNEGNTFEYQVVETGLTPAETGTLTSENPLAFSGLTDNTTYDFYLRAICTDGSLSEWVSVSFTTSPLPIVPDYLNDFSVFPGDLWTEGQGSPTNGPTGTTSSWLADGFGNNGFTGAARVNIYSTFPDEWLISPDFDLSAMTYYLNLDAAATEYASTLDAIWGDDDYAALFVSTDGGASWTEMYRWDRSNNPGAAGLAMPEIELTGYGVAKFAIYGESTVSNEDIDFFVDNFSITSSTLNTNDLEISQFTYFPNPVKDQLTIKAQNDVKDISVYNMLGQLVLRQVPNSLDCVVDMAAMQSGAYFVKVSIGNSVDTIRVLKK